MEASTPLHLKLNTWSTIHEITGDIIRTTLQHALYSSDYQLVLTYSPLQKVTPRIKQDLLATEDDLGKCSLLFCGRIQVEKGNWEASYIR